MRLRFTSRAITNLIEIADYLHERNPGAGRRVRADIYAGLQDLLLFPNVGRKQRNEGVRKFVTRRYAYLIYYSVNEPLNELVVLSIRHPARRRDQQDA